MLLRGIGATLSVLVASATLFASSGRAEERACVPKPNDNGKTPLMVAAERGDVPAVRQLIRDGVDVNESNAFGETPLIASAGMPAWWPTRPQRPGSVTAMRLLLARGADVNARTVRGHTALMGAVWSGNASAVEVLLDAGADVNAAAAAGETPIFYAAGHGFERIVELLLLNGADPNLGRDWNGDTPLTAAIRQAPGIRATLDEFCRKGVACKFEFFAKRTWDVPRVLFGYPPLTKNGQFDQYLRVVRLLLRNGADLTVVNRNGNVPLTLAAAFGHGRMVRLLLEYDADVNATDRAMGDGTALIIATRMGNAAMVKAILQKHPDLDRRDRWGKTALDYAIEDGEPSAIRTLKEAGAH